MKRRGGEVTRRENVLAKSSWRERESESVCERAIEKERESVCVRERERESRIALKSIVDPSRRLQI